jgi:hypothetical protein
VYEEQKAKDAEEKRLRKEKKMASLEKAKTK